jgi:hypothetical protein
MLSRFAPGICRASGPGSVMRDVRQRNETALEIHHYDYGRGCSSITIPDLEL